ncbi:hypothetical protein DFH28DRAFT_304269 [Melampsora americana]|nr:hypothetical protein DFH28DRAFT_304269 [Melampsora americana]
MANNEETVLELDEDFLKPGPVRALSRTPSHISQSNFFQTNQAREVAQDGDVDGEAAEAMRATRDDLELEEDFDFYIDDSRLSADGERSTDNHSRTAHLRSIATQPISPAHVLQSNDQVTHITIEGDPLPNKKQKLASEDEDELEIEDEFDFLQPTEAASNHPIPTSMKSNLAALAPSKDRDAEDQLDELEMEDEFKEILHTKSSEHPQVALPLEPHTSTNQISSGDGKSVSDPASVFDHG